MTKRAEVWKHYLLGDYEHVQNARKMYHNIVVQHPYLIDSNLQRQIEADVPRTSFGTRSTPSPDKLQKIVKTLLIQYVQVMPCDGYLQGFNYIAMILYRVYSNNDAEFALADTWWSMVSVLAIIRPMIPDHDPRDFMRYTDRWSRYYKNHIKLKNARVHAFLEPHYNIICPMITVKWLMIWFAQLFEYNDLLIVWDALITCDPSRRTKLMAIIAANVTIQQESQIENWSRTCPSELGGRMYNIRAREAETIINESRAAMIEYKLLSV